MGKTPQYILSAQERYRKSEKGKAWLKSYSQTIQFKINQKRYRSSEKAKQRRKDHPEIYGKGIEKMLNNNVCHILTEHHEKMLNDPERLSTEFICEMSGIRVEEKR
jgi:hypothetical protein